VLGVPPGAPRRGARGRTPRTNFCFEIFPPGASLWWGPIHLKLSQRLLILSGFNLPGQDLLDAVTLERGDGELDSVYGDFLAKIR
jgi:hypothetical protein